MLLRDTDPAVRKTHSRTDGSVTIEASVSMVVFLFAIVSLLSVINISRLQSHMGSSLNSTALQMSQYSYFYYVSGLYSAASEIKETANKANQKLSDADSISEVIGGAISLIGGKTETGDPSDYVRTLMLTGLSGGMSAAESSYVTAPVSKALLIENLKKYGGDADKYLKSRGVVNGTAGLDFGMSGMFTAEAPYDICLTVCYKVRLPFFRGLEVNVMQNAETGAWLGGDKTKIKLDRADTGSEEDSSSKIGDSVWNMPPLDRGKYFTEIYRAEHGFSNNTSLPNGIVGFDSRSGTYYGCISINTFSPGYNDQGFSAASASHYAVAKARDTVKSIRKDNGNAGEAISVEFTVIIPEDASASVLNELRNYLNSNAGKLNKAETNIKVTYIVVRKGGNAGTND